MKFVDPTAETVNDDAPEDITFERITVELVLAQCRAGTLPEAVIVALLAGVGLHP